MVEVIQNQFGFYINYIQHIELILRIKQWSVFEEGGVCGAISKSAVNAQTVNGRPATVVSQPGHAVYTKATKVTSAESLEHTGVVQVEELLVDQILICW